MTPAARIRTFASLVLAPLAFAPPSLHAQAWVLDPAVTPTIYQETDALGSTAFTPLPDGRILAYGSLTHVGGVAAAGIALIKADGQVDTSFRAGLASTERVAVVAPISAGRFIAVIATSSIAAQPAGQVAMVAPDPRTPISPSPALFPDFVFSRSLDGTRVFMTSTSPPTTIRRYLPDGQSDPSFAPIACDGQMRLTPLRDGRTLVWGFFRALGGTTRNSLARLNADGSLDSTFAPTLAATDVAVTALAATADGSAVVSAFSYDANGRLVYSFVRFDANGVLDSRFVPPAINRAFDLLAVQTDGRVLAGSTTLGRYSPAGALDPGYSLRIPDLRSVSRIAPLANGRLAVEAWVGATNGTATPGVFVVGPEGQLERNLQAAPTVAATQRLLAIMPDDGLLVARGTSTVALVSSGEETAPAHANIAPVAFSPTRRSPGGITRLETDAVGRVWIGGSFTHVDGEPRPGLARFLPSGALDRTFTPAGGGWLLLPPDGRLIASQSVRLREDGSIDPTFRFPVELPPERVNWLAAAPDGRLLVAAFEATSYREQDLKLIWLAPDGRRLETLPTSFSHFTGGFASTGGPLPSGSPNVIDRAQVLDQGRLLVCGRFQGVNGRAQPGFVRLNRDGSIDSSYVAALSNFITTLLFVTPLPDGRVFVTGPLVGRDRFAYVTRLLRADGSMDGSFPPPTGGMSARARLFPDGSFFEAGRRFFADFSLDRNFAPSVPASLAVMSPGGEIWIAGEAPLRRLVSTDLVAITVGPRSRTLAVGSTVEFSVVHGSTQAATFRWTLNGQTIPGATSPALRIADATASVAGDYRAIVSIAGRDLVSPPATLTLTPNTSRLQNFSARGIVSPAAPLIAGFVANEVSARPLLLRAVGRGLPLSDAATVTTTFPGPVLLPVRTVTFNPFLLSDPILSVFRGTGLLGTNRGGAASSVSATLSRTVGAYEVRTYPDAPLSTNYGSALALTLGGGVHSAIAMSGDGSSGLCVLEGYDTASVPAPPLLRNISVLGRVANGADVLAAGFVHSGNGPLRLLIRGLGPTLGTLGLAGGVGDPELRIFSGDGSLVAVGTGGTATPAIIDVARRTGAFPLPTTSRDAAMLFTLEPGAYTVQLVSASGATGTGMIELYVVDF